jgi:hypothetical protein
MEYYAGIDDRSRVAELTAADGLGPLAKVLAFRQVKRVMTHKVGQTRLCGFATPFRLLPARHHIRRQCMSRTLSKHAGSEWHGFRVPGRR